MGYTAFYGMGPNPTPSWPRPCSTSTSLLGALAHHHGGGRGHGGAPAPPTCACAVTTWPLSPWPWADLPDALKNLDGLTNGPNGIVKVDGPSFSASPSPPPTRFYYLSLFFAVVVAVAITRLRFTGWAGLAVSVTTRSRPAARAFNLSLYKVLAYICGAGPGRVGRRLFASWQQGVFPRTSAGRADRHLLHGGHRRRRQPLGVVMGSIGLRLPG